MTTSDTTTPKSNTPRLSPAVLSTLDKKVTPQYNRAETKAGIVHLGIGAFHRAHQAFYTEAVMNQLGGHWRIIGCSLRSANVKTQLEPQDCLYTLFEKGVETKYQVIGAVKQVLVGPENPQAVIDAIASSDTKVITLTVTEKGYCHNPATGNLNTENPDILHDLSNPMAPKSAVGYVVAGLRQRRQNNLPGVTVLSCDNLPNNGHVTGKVVSQFAEQVAPELAAWIKDNVTFPCSMIDRIVPATTADDIAALEAHTHYTDEAMVVAEPFTQWVIEDNFCQGRPEWEKVGALLVEEVEIYENMKLRLLNGSHSLLAYSGYLGGYETINVVMEDEHYVQLCAKFMSQAALTFTPPAGFDVTEYQKELRQRYKNPGLKHRTWQIAMDGSQKVPQRWLATLRDLLAKGEDCKIMALALAAWMRYVSGVDENGNPIEVSDPFADTFQALYQKHSDDIPAYVNAFFSLDKIFDLDLIKNTELVASTTGYLQEMFNRDIKTVIANFVKS